MNGGKRAGKGIAPEPVPTVATGPVFRYLYKIMLKRTMHNDMLAQSLEVCERTWFLLAQKDIEWCW